MSAQWIQGGGQPLDALKRGSLFATEPRIIGLFCGKWPKKIRHHMGLRHHVASRLLIIHTLLSPSGSKKFTLSFGRISLSGSAHEAYHVCIHIRTRIQTFTLPLHRISLSASVNGALSGSVHEARDMCIHICIRIREIHFVLVVLGPHIFECMCEWGKWHMYTYGSDNFIFSLGRLSLRESVNEA